MCNFVYPLLVTIISLFILVACDNQEKSTTQTPAGVLQPTTEVVNG